MVSCKSLMLDSALPYTILKGILNLFLDSYNIRKMYLYVIILVFVFLSLINARLLNVLNLILEFLLDSCLVDVIIEVIFIQEYDIVTVISLVLFIDEYFVHEHRCV